MAQKYRYSIIIPMYNEEAVIEETYRRLKKSWAVRERVTSCCLSMTAVWTKVHR